MTAALEWIDWEERACGTFCIPNACAIPSWFWLQGFWHALDVPGLGAQGVLSELLGCCTCSQAIRSS
jgi:hypothetical protein